MAKKKGRTPKEPPEQMRFGIKCTDAERDAVWEKMNKTASKKRVTVSDFFLKAAGIR